MQKFYTSSARKIVLENVWASIIPVSFLIEGEKESDVILPLNCNIPFSSYLSLFRSKVGDYVSHYISKDKLEEIWFEYEGKPLQWHLPVGVLFDIHVSSFNLQNETSLLQNIIPWKISVKYRSFPSIIIPLKSEEVILTQFMQVCKEGMYLRFSNSFEFMNITKSDIQVLFKACEEGKFEPFHQISSKFLPSTYNFPSQQSTSRPQRVPLRVYFSGDAVSYVQRTVKWPSVEEEASCCLHQVLAELLPEIFKPTLQYTLDLISESESASLPVSASSSSIAPPSSLASASAVVESTSDYFPPLSPPPLQNSSFSSLPSSTFSSTSALPALKPAPPASLLLTPSSSSPSFTTASSSSSFSSSSSSSSSSLSSSLFTSSSSPSCSSSSLAPDSVNSSTSTSVSSQDQANNNSSPSTVVSGSTGAAAPDGSITPGESSTSSSSSSSISTSASSPSPPATPPPQPTAAPPPPPLPHVVTHGISIPLNTPVVWVVDSLAYPDTFVHLVVVPAEAPPEPPPESQAQAQAQAQSQGQAQTQVPAQARAEGGEGEKEAGDAGGGGGGNDRNVSGAGIGKEDEKGAEKENENEKGKETNEGTTQESGGDGREEKKEGIEKNGETEGK